MVKNVWDEYVELRKKLIELLSGDMCKDCYCEDCEHENNEKACIEHIKSRMADHLIANGVTIQKWIPVTERLPERGQIVLVCGNRKGIYTAEFRIDGKYPYFHKLNSKTHWCKPTHWMPLPEAPKEADGNG